MNENTLPKKRGLPQKAIPVEKKPSRAKAITAFVVLALGLAIMPSGFLLANVVQGEIDKGIADAVAVPHPHNKEFEEWETNDYKGAPKLYKSFTLWNLTNTEGALKGDIPTYVEEGPFVFREFNYKYNIDFSRDKDEVTFKEYSTFIQVAGDPI